MSCEDALKRQRLSFNDLYELIEGDICKIESGISDNSIHISNSLSIVYTNLYDFFGSIPFHFTMNILMQSDHLAILGIQTDIIVVPNLLDLDSLSNIMIIFHQKANRFLQDLNKSLKV